MKKILLLFMALPFMFISCSDDEEDEMTFEILCSAKVKTFKASCKFFFFEPGEYVSFERGDLGSNMNNYGLGIATKPDGTKVESIGYATYLKSEDKFGVAKYRNWSDKYKHPEIFEGTFYVVCVYDEFLGGRFPYKAKEFTKEKNKALRIEPVFTDKIYGIDGYKYFEWDE